MIPKPKVKYLPMRDWLELGQAIADNRLVGRKYFRAYDTAFIELGRGISVKADGKTYRAGRYFLELRVYGRSPAMDCLPELCQFESQV